MPKVMPSPCSNSRQGMQDLVGRHEISSNPSTDAILGILNFRKDRELNIYAKGIKLSHILEFKGVLSLNK